MRNSYSIKFITPIRNDYALLKSILTTFGHQADIDWCYQAQGKAQVVIVDADDTLIPQLNDECHDAKVIVYYTKDKSLAEQKPFVLKKPAHAREFLAMLKRVAQYLERDQQIQTTLEHGVRPTPKATVDYPSGQTVPAY